ncbi:nucleoporin Nup186/Nup192/Nup205 [Pseudomassariella vexata]|uniref:Nucleoporin Nup186/Nup192/Nup205 n=1 Tax=Pseudomassariella vexata TaxID=1141098 RepID=A0A1Y2DIZ3_9PEZI|nr:nucleoporin Nup186/Nup192/Nup205 [Pseudomassariella vexata]ORY59218.1 nucleoporin Nup186/Nup192/Nup205 [Pseudomassariella vexata]
MAEADTGLLDALQSLHGDLLAATERPKEQRLDLPAEIGPLLEVWGDKFKAFLDKPTRSKTSRDAVLSGKITLSDEEYTISKEFQEIALQVADEVDLDELETSRLVLESQNDEQVLGRSLRECAIIRFHQQRKYLLSCIRLFLELSRIDEMPEEIEDWLAAYVNELILGEGPAAKIQRLVPRCMAAMKHIREWLHKIVEQVTGATVLGHAGEAEFRETIEFSRVSLIQQHELLSVILCYAIERRVATSQDFIDFFKSLKEIGRYDYATVHVFPPLGAFITVFGSTEGNGDLDTSRKLNDVVCQQSEEYSRNLPCLHASVRAWWLAEYSGWYMDDAAGSLLQGVDIDAEDRQRSKQFTEALRDGAFDMLLAVAADVKSPEWQEPARVGIRQWLQRKAPALPPDTPPFSDFFQACLMGQMEVFIDAFISNLPDILRKLRIEEDEQRQLNQAHEQDLDLERFLLIIAFSYEGRPEAADAFWADPESNLAGFLQWASRRASTPLVSAFCEMLQSLSEDSESATSAHEFLLDDGHHAAGKIRRSLSLTWSQILKELDFFANKIREKPVPAQTHAYKTGKFGSEQAETEPESAMMLECYLRLMTKLSSQSETVRIFLLSEDKPNPVVLLFQLISSLVPSRLRACAFNTLSALMCRKRIDESKLMWYYLDSCLSGAFIASSGRTATTNPMPPSYYMEGLFEEMSSRFEESSSFIELLASLTCLPQEYPLNDVLPFQEDLGAATRIRPGIDPYIDFALGHIFAWRVQDASEVVHQRILRYRCLEFALTCLSTFNEDLIIFGNEASISVDAAISSTDLASYVSLHPSVRVMEWMFDSHVIKALLNTLHQDPAEVGAAAPDSPLILSILRAVEVITKVLDLQTTYLDLIRPIVKPQARTQSRSTYIPTSNGAYASVEDGLMTSLNLVANLGSYCGIGHAHLTLASLKLLEKISTSPKIISAWQTGPERQVRRNKAIVALEENGNATAIAGSFISEMSSPLDLYRKTESPGYQTKMYILDFLYSCIRANPDRPTVAHLLLGFQCEAETLGVEARSPFDQGASLFHTLLGIVVELVISDEGGMRQWLIDLKYRVMRVLRALWSSSLSSGIVLEQLRENEFVFHVLLQGLVMQPSSIWDGFEPNGPDFLTTPAAQGYVEYLSMRSMALEYITHELCSVTQSHTPALKRRIFDALTGQVLIDGGETMTIPSIFELQDFLPQEDLFATMPPELNVYRDLDMRVCLEEDDDSNLVYNLGKVNEILLLKRNQNQPPGTLVSQQEPLPADVEADHVKIYAAYLNRLTQVNSSSHKILKAWTTLLMVMTDSNDFKGTNRISFILQALQAILPSLEIYGSDNVSAAYELAKLAKVLLFSLDFSSMDMTDKQARSIGSLISDKLFQLFQACLQAIAKWTGRPQLRAIYYSISYRYITALVDHGQGILSGRHKTAKTVQVFGERLINVVCDDAGGGDGACQTAALTLLGTLVNLGRHENNPYVVETLNRLNFIGVLVDSLRNIMEEWITVSQSAPDQQHYQDAKLALLLQLCQTRDGAKNVLHANLFRAIDLSGLFSADPELQVNAMDAKALAHHYTLLIKVTRIIGAAIVSRGSHNVAQGRRFLTEHRLLVMHVLKRSAGIGAGPGRVDGGLEENIQELAEAFMVIIIATGFLEYESEACATQQPTTNTILFH